ncbi:MAG: hypothetical protein P8X90_32840 [Desulfobacterales bacterium]
MNRYQKMVLGIGVSLILLMCLFPPWISIDSFNLGRMGYSDGRGNTGTLKISKTRYAPIFRPPQVTSQARWAFEKKDILSSTDIYKHKSMINFKRLLIQAAAVALVFGVMLFVIRSKADDGDGSGST